MVCQNVFQVLRWKAFKIRKNMQMEKQFAYFQFIRSKSILTCLFSPFTLKITRMKTLKRSAVSSKDDFAKEACSLYAVNNCLKNKRINQSKHENHFVMYNSFSLLFNYSVIGQQVDVLDFPEFLESDLRDLIFWEGDGYRGIFDLWEEVRNSQNLYCNSLL